MHRSNVVAKNNNEKQRFSKVVSQAAISEVFKGGSMGKGITVPENFSHFLKIFSIFL